MLLIFDDYAAIDDAADCAAACRYADVIIIATLYFFTFLSPRVTAIAADYAITPLSWFIVYDTPPLAIDYRFHTLMSYAAITLRAAS